MFYFTREWILANQRRVRICVGGGEILNFYCGGELTEKIPLDTFS